MSVSPVSNTLSLVLRDEGVMRFIKYVSAGAPSSRWDISTEYKVRLVEAPLVEEEEEEVEEEDGDNESDVNKA